LLLILEQCRWVYNKLLSIINESKSTPPKRKMQSLLPKLKEEQSELKEVNANLADGRFHALQQPEGFSRTEEER